MGLNRLPHAVARTAAVAAVRIAIALSVTFTVAADAREPLYGALDNPDLLNCENIYWHGVRAEAAACYRSLLGSALPALRAEALWAMNDLQGANTAFQDAVTAEPANAMRPLASR